MAVPPCYAAQKDFGISRGDIIGRRGQGVYAQARGDHKPGRQSKPRTWKSIEEVNCIASELGTITCTEYCMVLHARID
jgi:hypothetical protein